MNEPTTDLFLLEGVLAMLTVFLRMVMVGLLLAVVAVGVSYLRWRSTEVLFGWMDEQEMKLTARGRRVVDLLHVVPRSCLDELEARTRTLEHRGA